MNELERFLAVMDYKPVDRAPNHELGVWPQTVVRWVPPFPRRPLQSVHLYPMYVQIHNQRH